MLVDLLFVLIGIGIVILGIWTGITFLPFYYLWLIPYALGLFIGTPFILVGLEDFEISKMFKL